MGTPRTLELVRYSPEAPEVSILFAARPKTVTVPCAVDGCGGHEHRAPAESAKERDARWDVEAAELVSFFRSSIPGGLFDRIRARINTKLS